MKKIFEFWEKIKGFDVRVLNEREVRAGAGILFFFALIAFMNAWLTGNFYITKVFVIAFLIDFIVRIFVNPKYSPSLVIGRYMVNKQKPEYVWAPQKKFAWWIWFILALTMFFLVVLNDVVWPINLFVCLACILLLFFESAFGICIWCKIYNIFYKGNAKNCPGWTCEIHKKEKIQKINIVQFWIVILFLSAIFFISQLSTLRNIEQDVIQNLPVEEISKWKDDCIVPDWAKSIWHEEKWKLHNNCK